MRSFINFTLKGRRYHMSRSLTQGLLKDVKPNAIRKYYVVVNGKQYPIKQVISVYTNLGLSEFGSADAALLLSRIGFKIKSKKGG